MKLFKTILSLILVISLTTVTCQGNRKKMFEEMLQSMKDMESSFSKFASQLKSTEANVALFNDKLNIMMNAIELTKVRSRMIEEKFASIEAKVSTIEETIKFNLVNLISNGSAGKAETEKSLLKIMNVLTDLYGLVKENHSKDKSRALLGDGLTGSSQVEANMRKIVREEVNILKHELVSDMNITGFTGRLQEMFALLVNLQEIPCKKSDTEESEGSSSKSMVSRDELCPDISRLKNQVSFAVQEIRTNMSTIMDSLSNSHNDGKCSPSGARPSTSSVHHVSQADSPRGAVARSYDCPVMDPRAMSKGDCSHSRPSFPQDCTDIIKSNSTCPTKIYAVRTGSPLRVQRVYCDMADKGGGWTVIMRRGKFSEKRHHVDFRSNWQSYKRGFGDIADEFWLGNDIIHHLTTKEPQMLQVDLRSYDGQCISLTFKRFAILGEAQQYRLIVDEPLGPHQDIAETLLMLNNSNFVTLDVIKDSGRYICSDYLVGGWWVDPAKCPLVHLTGIFKGEDEKREVDTGIRWMTFKENESLKEVQMKLRPVSFLNQI